MCLVHSDIPQLIRNHRCRDSVSCDGEYKACGEWVIAKLNTEDFEGRGGPRHPCKVSDARPWECTDSATWKDFRADIHSPTAPIHRIDGTGIIRCLSAKRAQVLQMTMRSLRLPVDEGSSSSR